jgi:hypothetical protein
MSNPAVSLDDCGCCEAPSPAQTAISNPPGLSGIYYRIGTQPIFAARMQAAIGASPDLLGLTTREASDASMGLVDAWATVLDVLTFYEERIASEGWLRTATQTQSVYRLAAEIGYLPKPGVAADVMLAFQLDISPGAPRIVTIPKGTKVQSLPEPNVKPQTFETVDEGDARPQWNVLLARRTVPQHLSIGAQSVVLAGTSTLLRPGDGLLFIGYHRRANAKSQHWDFRVLETVTVDTVAGTTTVTWGKTLGHRGAHNVRPEHSDLHIYAMKTRAGVFGFNAPDWRLVTHEVRQHYAPGASNGQPPQWPHFRIFPSRDHLDTIDLDAVYAEAAQHSYVILAIENYLQLYTIREATQSARADFGLSGKTTRISLLGDNLRNFARHVRDSVVHLQGPEVTLADIKLYGPIQGRSIPLDRVVEGLLPGKQLIVSGKPARAVFSGLTHHLALTPPKSESPLYVRPGESLQMTRPFKKDLRGVHTWHVRAPGGQEADISGPASWLRWTPAFDDDKPIAEMVTLQSVDLIDGTNTRVQLQRPLANCYDRGSLRINANVFKGTHGETKQEVLGSGDASQPFQTFRLRQAPLTYVHSADPSGGSTTLEVRVNDVVWQEVPTLYGAGPHDQVYVVRIAADGQVAVEFGDGITGARLPTGVENVKATYRVGAGLAGMVGADRIKLLMTRPLGVQSVDNPVEAGIAADPETLDSARTNAPQQVVTFSRVVSLTDFEDFARSFAGIAKARAAWVWNGQSRMVYVTVAGTNGAEVKKDGETQKGLIASITTYADPHQRFQVSSYERVTFVVEASMFLDPDALQSVVLPAALAALQDAFSFDRRSLGQPVYESEVIAVLQATPGVLAVDLTRLHVRGGTTGVAPALPAHRARWDNSVLRPAQLLTIGADPTDVLLTGAVGK